MHYAFDLWMNEQIQTHRFERYADDAIIHCKTQAETEEILEKLKKRLKECKLELHPTKTKMVYCKDKDRVKEYPITILSFWDTLSEGIHKTQIGEVATQLPSSGECEISQAFRDKIKAMRIHSQLAVKLK